MATDNNLVLLQRKIDDFCSGHDDEDICFGMFAADTVLKHRELSFEQLEDGNTDGSEDGGIDGVYLFVHGKWADHLNKESFYGLQERVKIDLHIFQTKNSEGYHEWIIEKLSSTFDEVFDFDDKEDKWQSLYNSNIVRCLGTFRDIYINLASTELDVNVHLYYVAKSGTPTEQMKRKRERLIEKVEKNLIPGSNCCFDFIDASRLLELTQRPRRTKLDLKFSDTPTAADDAGRSYIGLVNLVTYFDFINGEDGTLRTHLFEANVRDWHRDSTVNEQILDSLQTKTVEEFWWLNNGVTILATKIRPKGKTLTIFNPAIVNGLQTSTTIYNHFSKHVVEPVDARSILVRVIEVSEEIETREEIIRATNSQNRVPQSAFISLDSIHRRIESYFLDQKPQLFYDRRHNSYKNQGKRARDIISIQRLAQCVIATVLWRPDDARGRPGDYLKQRSDEKYSSIFDDSFPLPLYYFCALFQRKIEEILRHPEIIQWAVRSQRQSIKYHLMTYIVLRHLNVPRHAKLRVGDLNSRLELSEIDDNLMIESATILLELLRELRAMPEAFRWRNFEESLFHKLDAILPGGARSDDE